MSAEISKLCIVASLCGWRICVLVVKGVFEQVQMTHACSSKLGTWLGFIREQRIINSRDLASKFRFLSLQHWKPCLASARLFLTCVQSHIYYKRRATREPTHRWGMSAGAWHSLIHWSDIRKKKDRSEDRLCSFLLSNSWFLSGWYICDVFSAISMNKYWLNTPLGF